MQQVPCNANRYVQFGRGHWQGIRPRPSQRPGRGRRSGNLPTSTPKQGKKPQRETGARFCQAAVLSGNGPDAAYAKARAANGQERILITCAGGGNAMITIRKDRETGAMKLFPTAELWPHRQLFVDAHGGRPHFESCEIR